MTTMTTARLLPEDEQPVDEQFAHMGEAYRLTTTYHLGGHTVRVRVHRSLHYPNQSFAIAEVLTPALMWTDVADSPSALWHDKTPYVNRAEAEKKPAEAQFALTRVSDSLVARARAILSII